MGLIRWTPWKPLATCREQRPMPPGAYRIRCRGRVIGRAIGVDGDGVLDIGKSVHLRRRLAAFFRFVTAAQVRHGHMAGWRYLDLGAPALPAGEAGGQLAHGERCRMHDDRPIEWPHRVRGAAMTRDELVADWTSAAQSGTLLTSKHFSGGQVVIHVAAAK
jgi:hypothetical protein